MPDKYFEHFPKIVYNDSEAVDITKRTAILNRVSSNPYVFYPYELTTYERPDQFSYRYYQDQYASWLIYFTNKVLDPYYEWYLQYDEFLSLMEKKYGSVVESQRKIKYYRNNWVSENGIYITPADFERLSDNQKTYYQPSDDNEIPVKRYKRKENDWIIDTNKIYCYGVDAPENYLKNFKPDEIVKIYIDERHTGTAQFDSYKLKNPYDYEAYDEVYKKYVTKTLYSNTITLKHMSGFFATNVKEEILVTPDSYLLGTESKLKVKLLNVDPAISPDNGIVVKLAEPINDEIAKFYSPVTYYEYENELNEYNKTVRVMDSRYKDLAAKDLKRLMKA